MYIDTIYHFIRCFPCTVRFVALNLISVVSAHYVSMVISHGVYPREVRIVGKWLLEQQKHLGKVNKLSGSVSAGLAIFIMITILKTENDTSLQKNTQSIFVTIFKKPYRAITIQLKPFKMLVYKF